MQRGEIQYAKSGDHHIAWREYVGDAGGDHEVVMVSGANFPMDSLPDDPVANRMLEGLAGLGRLILFDRRGIALSDSITDWDTPLYEQWADDLAAVIVASGCERPAVFSWCAQAVARCCSVRRRDLVGRLVLFNPGAPLNEDDAAWVTEFVEELEQLLAGDLHEDMANPGRGGDPDFRQWSDEAGRLGASPSQARRLSMKIRTDPPFDNTLVKVPTLVISRSPSRWMVPREFFERAARQIPDAHHVPLGSGDVNAVGLGIDDLLAEISRFVTGEVQLPEPERQLTAILFTDLVDSTSLAVASGDEEWKRVLDRHDAATRQAVVRSGGEVVKMTGDGALALLPSATAAVAAGREIRSRLADVGLDVRVGVHIGEVDRRGEDVSGVAVNVAARVMAQAAAGQVAVTDLVARVIGVDGFTSIGEVALKGVDGTWTIYAAK